jgi:hypothetical protein
MTAFFEAEARMILVSGLKVAQLSALHQPHGAKPAANAVVQVWRSLYSCDHDHGLNARVKQHRYFKLLS